MADAIAVHDDQAALFARRYEELGGGDPFRSAFHYGRAEVARWMAERLGEGRGRLAIDAGCGAGFWLGWLAHLGFRPVGLDGAAQMLGHARAAGQPVVRADVRALPIRTASVDVAISIEVVRYLPDAAPALAELRRVLRPGGLAIVTAAPRWALHGYAAINQVAARLPVPGLTPLRQFFTSASGLARALTAAGFSDVEVDGRFLGPFTWLDRLAPALVPTLLRRWAPLDRRLWSGAAAPLLRELSNHLLAVARVP